MKNTTKTKKTSSPSSDSKETANEIAQDIFRESLIAVRDEIRDIRTGKAKPKKYTPTESIAFLGKQAAAFAAEQRKAEAAELRRNDAITEDRVLEWFRSLDEQRQGRLVSALQSAASSTRRSGLA